MQFLHGRVSAMYANILPLTKTETSVGLIFFPLTVIVFPACIGPSGTPYFFNFDICMRRTSFSTTL